MPGWPTSVARCIEEAVALSPRLVEHAIDQACTALEEESRRSADAATRQELALASFELAHQRLQWRVAFAGALRKAAESQDSEPRARMMVNPSTLTFTLVDDNQVAESIESSRLAQQLESLVDKALAELDRYMSSALGLDGIQPEQNPLRPKVIAQALRGLMNDPAPKPGRPALWMRHMAEPIAADLRTLYQNCCQALARANVQQADYRVLTNAAPLGMRNTEAAATGSGVVPLRGGADGRGRSAVSSWIELASQRIGGPALRDFLFGPAREAQEPLAPAYYRQIDEEIAALEARGDEASQEPWVAGQYQHMPAVDRPVREVGTAMALSREAWGDYAAPRQRSLVRTRLRKQAQQMGQVIGLDLVRQLVDQVAQDPRLLAPVREAIVALEPALARLALNAPRFFGEEDNPARRLLEGVAQRSFRYNDEFSSEFSEFFEGVRERFNGLNQLDDVPDAAPFEEALAGLARAWAERDQDEERRRAQVVEAVQFAERRQAEADQIAWDLSQRSDLDGTPAVVQEFVFGPWALVIAHARLHNQKSAIDPGGYIGVIADLLWSVKREQTLRDPARAFDVIPRVLVKLRAGLDLLGHAPSQTQVFFQALERLHRPVLKLRARHRKQAFDLDSAVVPIDDDLRPAPAQKPQAGEDLWLDEGELREFGFEDTMPSDYADLEPPSVPAPMATAAPTAAPVAAGGARGAAGVAGVIPVRTVAGVALAPEQADALIGALQEGSWVDLFSKQRWRRAQLTWASAKRTLFMFVSHGGQPHSMTKRSLQQLVINRMVRPVDSGEVVQQALEALVQERSEPLAA
ncbi:hypothetical protein GCM10027034_40990 [Ramlibacter solisilvae]|uniref:DUF1631 family protein n=1 Tax=Ramlibacter tataouinensis TaxID=94132 RepID=UPI000777DD0F|nr:DUF1631 family protein [Ramlibacter tataouinensis]